VARLHVRAEASGGFLQSRAGLARRGEYFLFARLDFLAPRKPHRVPEGKRASRSGNWLVRHSFLALSLLVLLICTPALLNKSVDWDDGIYLIDTPAHLGLTPHGIEFAFTSVGDMYWQPLTWLSFELDAEAFGASLFAHHLVNILLHALTAGLLALLLRRMGASPYLALAGSAFWALHPLRVESYAWIAERKDVLFVFFVVAALLLYTRYAENPSLKRFLPWLGCAFLALMSKPTAMVLPVILILLDWWPLHRIGIPRQLPQTVPQTVDVARTPAETLAAPSPPPRPNPRSPRTPRSKRATAPPQPAPLQPTSPLPAPPTRRASIWSNRWLPILDKIPVALASLAVFFLTVAGQGGNMMGGFGFVTRLSSAVVTSQSYAGPTAIESDFGFATRLSNAVVGYVRYLGMIAWPAPLSCLYPYRHEIPLIQVALAALLLGLITFATVYQWRRRPWLLMGWLWFLLTFLPNPAQAIADRFTEIPMIGVAIALTWSASEVLNLRPQWTKPLAWTAAAVLVALSLATVHQIAYWRDSETLLSHAVAVGDSAIMRYNLARVLEREERYAEAEADFKASISLDPNEARGHNNYALLLIKLNRPAEAVAEAQAAVRADPSSPLAAKTLAQALLRRGDLEGAFNFYDRSISLGSDARLISAFLNDYGASLARKGEFGKAELLIRKAVQLDPSLLEARRNLVLVLLRQNRYGEARAALDQAIAQTGKHRIYEGLASQVPLN
jgi:tetratricopeptide (TPR) repeat protein